MRIIVSIIRDVWVRRSWYYPHPHLRLTYVRTYVCGHGEDRTMSLISLDFFTVANYTLFSSARLLHCSIASFESHDHEGLRVLRELKLFNSQWRKLRGREQTKTKRTNFRVVMNLLHPVKKKNLIPRLLQCMRIRAAQEATLYTYSYLPANNIAKAVLQQNASRKCKWTIMSHSGILRVKKTKWITTSSVLRFESIPHPSD